MPRMSGIVSVAGNATSSNQLAGLLDEFMRANSAVRLMATSASVAATPMNCTFVVGNTSVTNDQAISIANRFPIIPDDVVTQIGAYRGERLILTFRNTAVGAINVFWAVDVEPIG